MPFAAVMAMGDVGFEDVSVAGFEEAEDAGLVDYTGATVVSEGSEEIFVVAVFLVHGTEFRVVFTKKCVSLCFG